MSPHEYKNSINSAKLVFAGVHRHARNAREHAHSCMELILINEGSCTVHAGDRTLYAEAGEIITMPPHQVHDQVSRGYIDTVYCGFVSNPEIDCPEPHVVPLPDATFIRECMQLLAAVSLNQIQASEEAADAVLSAVLAQLRHQHVLHHELAQVPPLLRTALRYMEDHLGDPVTVDSLARQMRASASTLHLLFRTHLDTTPMRHLRDLRMQAARTALRSPYLSVKEVAAICGYPDVNHFVRTFRKAHGQPPGQWRKRQETTI